MFRQFISASDFRFTDIHDIPKMVAFQITFRKRKRHGNMICRRNERMLRH